MRARKRIGWPTLGFLLLGILIAGTILPMESAIGFASKVGDHQQSDPHQQGGSVSDSDGGVYPLPFEWQGEATVTAEDLSRVAPPLEVIASEGDFTISYVPTSAGNVIRILPDQSGGQPGRSIEVAWRLSQSATNPRSLRAQ